jgi:hypothetical protein
MSRGHEMSSQTPQEEPQKTNPVERAVQKAKDILTGKPDLEKALEPRSGKEYGVPPLAYLPNPALWVIGGVAGYLVGKEVYRNREKIKELFNRVKGKEKTKAAPQKASGSREAGALPNS